MTANPPNRNLAILFSVLSVLFSFGCLFYGMAIFTSPDVPQRVQVFAYAVIGYGVGNIYILSTAWRARSSWCPGASKAITVCLFGVLAMDRLASGIHTATQAAVLVVVGCMLWINWQAIHQAVQRDAAPAQPDRKGKKRKKSR